MMTNCIICGLPLTEHESIAANMGPICRGKAIMSDNFDEVVKHLPGQHAQSTHGRRAAGGVAAAQDALNVGGNPTPAPLDFIPGNKISFYRRGGRRPGTVAGTRPDGRLNVMGDDGKKYIVDPNRKRSKVQFVGDEPKKTVAISKKPAKKPPVQQKPDKETPKKSSEPKMPRSKLSKADIRKLKALDDPDPQRRSKGYGSDYPESNVPDMIQSWSDQTGKTSFVGVEAQFKNTSEQMAQKWLRGRMNAVLGKQKAAKGEYSTFQSGDYHDDWVTAQVEFNRHQSDWVNKAG